jgi:hypothetical protein
VNVKQRDETVVPGQTGTVSVPGASVTLMHDASSSGNAVLIVAVVPTSVAANLSRVPTSGNNRVAGASDIRILNPGPGDVAILTLSYDNDDNKEPTLFFFNKATGTDEAVPRDFYQVDTVNHVILLRLDRFTIPSLQDLGGTVFTITVAQDLGPEAGAPAPATFTVSAPTTLPNTLTIAALVTPTEPAGLQGSSVLPAQGSSSPQGLQLAAAVTVAVGLGSNGGGGDPASGGGGSGTPADTGPLRYLWPPPSSPIVLPAVTVSPSRIELPPAPPNPTSAQTPDQNPPTGGANQERLDIFEDEKEAPPLSPAAPGGSSQPGPLPVVRPRQGQGKPSDTVFQWLGEREDRGQPSVDLVLAVFALGGLGSQGAGRRAERDRIPE